MKILLTCFDAFGGEEINPSSLIAESLPEKISGADIIKLRLPTTYSAAPAMIAAAIDEHRPDIVISLGQAGGRDRISIERVAINLKDAAIPDNEGIKFSGESIDKNSPAAYFSTLPCSETVEALKKMGIPAAVSLSAGAFICNCVMYSALHHIAQKKYKTLSGFIHVPFLPEQAISKNAPYVPIDYLKAGITSIIEFVAGYALANG